MDSVSPIIPPLFDEREEDDEDDDVLSTILQAEEEGDEDAILPPNQSHPLSTQEECSPSPVQMDMDLLQICRWAVVSLFINWPSKPAGKGAERDLYDGKRLPSRLPQVTPLIPSILTGVAEMESF